MFDANYFRSVLQGDIIAAGGSPVVELSLLNGHVHRARAVIAIAEGYVTLAVHQVKGDLSHERPRWDGATADGGAVRVVVAYDSIAAIVLDPSPVQVKARPGFASL